MAVELSALVREQNSDLKDVAAGLFERKREKIGVSMADFAFGVVTARPEKAVPSPYSQARARRPSASTAKGRQKRTIRRAGMDQCPAEWPSAVLGA